MSIRTTIPYPQQDDGLPTACSEHSLWQASNDIAWMEYLLDEYPS